MKKLWFIQFENGRYVSWDDFDIDGKSNLDNMNLKIYCTVNHEQVKRREKQLAKEYLKAGIQSPLMKIVYKEKNEVLKTCLCKNHE